MLILNVLYNSFRLIKALGSSVKATSHLLLLKLVFKVLFHSSLWDCYGDRVAKSQIKTKEAQEGFVV